jgi:hypothetical protein
VGQTPAEQPRHWMAQPRLREPARGRGWRLWRLQGWGWLQARAPAARRGAARAEWPGSAGAAESCFGPAWAVNGWWEWGARVGRRARSLLMRQKCGGCAAHPWTGRAVVSAQRRQHGPHSRELGLSAVTHPLCGGWQRRRERGREGDVIIGLREAGGGEREGAQPCVLPNSEGCRSQPASQVCARFMWILRVPAATALVRGSRSRQWRAPAGVVNRLAVPCCRLAAPLCP